jgi:hypothetical protein
MKETAETLGVDFDPDFIKHLKKKLSSLFLVIHFVFISGSDDEGNFSNQKRCKTHSEKQRDG